MSVNKSEFKLNLFEYLGDGNDNFFFVADFESGYCHWSDNAADEFFISKNPVTDTSFWRQLLHPSDYQQFVDSCKAMQSLNLKRSSGDFRFRLSSGAYAWVQCTVRIAPPAKDGKVLITGLVSRIQVKSNIDSVTNLRYIGGFRATLADIAQQQIPWGILLIGIDDFKRINDLYSYSFGDEVLASFAIRLQENIPSDSLLFRLDGDGFGILSPNVSSDELVKLFNNIQTLAQQPFKLRSLSVSFTISGGCCRYPDDGADGDSLYRNARIAFVESKVRGKKQFTICTPLISDQAQRRMRILEKLRECVQDDCRGFSLCYQPLIKAQDEQLYGCEVLMRWSHPDFPKGVTPYEFIPILENSGLIFDVNKWLLNASLSQCAEWVRKMPSFQMNVNFSCAQFEDADFKFFVMRTLAEKGVPASSLTLELTESGEVKDVNSVNNVFEFLRSQGIKIALDDFGTGYSSFSIFQLLSADELKIDRSFLQRLTYNITDQTLVRQIIELCHSMNMIVCVEGVESTQVTEIVRQFGPEILQGFYYGAPVTAELFEQHFLPDMIDNTQKPLDVQNAPERERSMVYAALRPTQPMSMEEIINNAHAGIFQVAMDANFSFITCNEGYRRMLGYTTKQMEEMFGNYALGIVYEDDKEYVNEEIRKQLGEGDTVIVEFRVVRADGIPIWILGTGNVVKSRDGTSSLVVIIVENDRLKNKQLEVERVCRRYDRVLANVPTGLKCVRYDESFTIDYISPGFLSLTGFTLDDIMNTFGGKYINLICEEDRAQVINDILEQLEVSDVVTMRYRTPCKDGSMLWVETASRLCPPEEDGIQRAYSSVITVSSDKVPAKSSFALSLANRFQIAAAQWGDVLFEYQFATNTVSFSDNYQAFFGRPPCRDKLLEMGFVHPEDRELLENAINLIYEGQRPSPLEIRYRSEERGYFWTSLLFTLPGTIGNDPVSVIGRISDIHEEKTKRDKLVAESRIDSLTGVLNKRSIEEEIRKRLTVDNSDALPYAFCILDIDDFKALNDTFGHMFGDKVLAQAAMRLRELLGSAALIGRSGGDEFVIYMPLSGDYDDVHKLGADIVELLCSPVDLGGTLVRVSVSIGIAVYPADGTAFYDLFQRADSALYLVKAEGKGSYRIAARRLVDK